MTGENTLSNKVVFTYKITSGVKKPYVIRQIFIH